MGNKFDYSRTYYTVVNPRLKQGLNQGVFRIYSEPPRVSGQYVKVNVPLIPGNRVAPVYSGCYSLFHIFVPDLNDRMSVQAPPPPLRKEISYFDRG